MNTRTPRPTSAAHLGGAVSILTLLGPSGLAAQDARSTLAQLTEEAAAIAQVRVQGVRIDGTIRRVRLLAHTILKGSPAQTIELSEPSRQACGSALHGVIANTSYLAFLRKDSRLVTASARSLVRLTPVVLSHVRSLITANKATHANVILSGLASTDERIRRDSALSLATHRGIASLDPAARKQLLLHLDRSLTHADVTAVSLLRVVQRLGEDSAVETLVSHYLNDGTRALDDLLVEAMHELDHARVVRAIESRLPAAPRAWQRGMKILEGCADPSAEQCLNRFSKHSNPVFAKHAGVALTERTTTAPRVPRFRSIRPRVAR